MAVDEKSREDKEPLSPLPMPTLPKGGGAIRDIGEKFTTNAATGTGQMSVPIYTSPGRAGFHPKLSLSYDSGRGNGSFGMGWSLSVPQITRKTDKGLPRYVDSAESDVFIISGAEDLVPALNASGTPDEVVNGTTRIRRYRPRVEGLFARIERMINETTGDSSWRVTTKDDVRSTYGSTAASRIADPADPRRVFTWLLDETRDDKGNVIAYEYKREDQANLDPTVGFEKTRPVANAYLKTIYYGNQAPFSAGNWHFRVVFDYGEHNQAAPTPAEAQRWSSRLDPFSTFRSTFEIRTYRLCQRVLMFHKFPELGTDWVLVRSTEFGYEPNRVATYLRSAQHKGWIANQPPLTFPAVEFDYSRPTIEASVRTVDARNLPYGVDESHYRLIDLDGEGVQGVLTEQGSAWFYARNLGGGRFGATERIAKKPSVASLGGGAQHFADLDGSGAQHLVQLGSDPPGFARRTDDGWTSLQPFKSVPNLDWRSHNLQMLDLDGDGLADVLLTEDQVLSWYPSLGESGYGPRHTTPRPSDEEKGPAVVFADEKQSIHVADMTGDGLPDIVRIRNGSVCYWPNRGYGRFGAKVVMRNAPRFDHPDAFNPAQIRLADVDGSGTADLLYLKSTEVRIWSNESGNGYSDAQTVTAFPRIDDLASVTVTDLLGKGTACLVWSSPLPHNRGRAMRYVDLMSGVKPHLLTFAKNNLGLETNIEYSPSTRFYLQDRGAQMPWITKLPFPVHVVDKVTIMDGVSKTKLVTSYRYHHGFYDGIEREFSGFGMVEQWDAESYAQYIGAGLFTSVANIVEKELFVPPVHTKTWFHTGAYLNRGNVSRQFAHEYFAGDAQATPTGDTWLPSGLTAEEEEEACRSLRGRILRREIYTDDDTPLARNPYFVSEKSYRIKLLQHRDRNRHACFHTMESESLNYYYERNPADPRVSHEITLDVDAFGNVTKSASIGYTRRVPAHPEQATALITYSESDFVNRDDSPDFYRIGVPCDLRTYEITGLQPAPGPLFNVQEFLTAAEGAAETPYESDPNAAEIQKRLIARQRTLYYKDDLSSSLPLGVIESRALPFETYRAAFTPGLITKVFGPRLDADLVGTEAKYILRDELWWSPSGRQIFDSAHFYLPIAFTDPFGNTTNVTYDNYSLVVAKTTDALNNVVTAQTNYRVMQPWHLTDANQNRTAVRIDALGMIIATAVMGKQGQNEGDVLNDSTPEASAADDPTTKLEYELFNWTKNSLPNYVHTLTREHHRDPTTRWQESYSYSDGFGREVMKKVQAEPGMAPARGDDGKLLRDDRNQLILKDTSPNARWVGTGRTVFNNKGKPVKKYEPFFSSASTYEDEQDLVEWGVTPVLHYDPPGRLIRTDLPNGTYSKVEFDTWEHITWDENDTVKDSRWYADRQALPATDPEHVASEQSAAHYGTPTLAYLDVLGRVFLTVADNGPAGKYETRLRLDIEGNQRLATDARGIQILISDFNVMGKQVHTISPDAGERWLLLNVVDNPIRAWNGRGFQIRSVCDELHRPTHVFVQEGAAAEILAERTVYGEKHPDALALNLCEKQYQYYDSAGVATNHQFDFKGNLLSSSRVLTRTYRQQVDWSVLSGLNEIQQITNAAAPQLQAEAFASSSSFDALNRPVTLTTPDQSVIRPSYNEANLLKKLDVLLHGSANVTAFIEKLDYDAKGQRVLCEYANGASTEYNYDWRTFRLSKLRTTRKSDNAALQDLAYTYDPVGNITQVADAAQQTIYFSNIRASANSKYVYDAIYRLTQASGREHVGQNANAQPDYDDRLWTNLPQPNDGKAMRVYTERYQYDAVGNILQMAHQANGSGWTRRYAYDASSNRLQSTSLPGDPDGGPYSARYAYDSNGNMIQMPHLAQIDWDFKDQIQRAGLGGGGAVYCAYNEAGSRVRKVVERPGGLTEERIYLGNYEVFRRRSNGNLAVELQTLHIMDEKQRVALVETTTVDTFAAPGSLPSVLTRCQLENHLGSAVVEVDESAAVISYEEFFPYGNTSYQAVDLSIDVSLKRYRFTGREHDDETSFYYHGARYYACWLGRWVSSDPKASGARCPYAYANDSPVVLTDPNGTEADQPSESPSKFIYAISPQIRQAFGEALRSKVTEYDRITANQTWFDKLLDFNRDRGRHILESNVNAYEKALAAAKPEDYIVPLPRFPGFGADVELLPGYKSQYYDFEPHTREQLEFWDRLAKREAAMGLYHGILSILGSIAAAAAAKQYIATLSRAPADPLYGIQARSPIPQVDVKPDVYTHAIFAYPITGPDLLSESRGYDRRSKTWQQRLARAQRWWGAPFPASDENIVIGHITTHAVLPPGEIGRARIQDIFSNAAQSAIERYQVANRRELTLRLNLNPFDPQNPFFTRPTPSQIKEIKKGP